MSIERNTASVSKFFRIVRNFSIQTPVWGTAIRYFTKPDERFDLTLVSRRVYGRVDEFIVIMAAAGLDSVEQALPEQLLVLPTESQLMKMKIDAGYENDASAR
ncbi:hypothetical protein [Undibacterium crateris]|uniref:hypothetical protein n=1 Tax=Undibacterium crateris TaxID=2528175 RepID=UPI0013894C1C|nr:hypothetical protein [Undibacterium crateris]NDI85078.1 hypothetical protein [Undibacterium crateris]